MAARNAPVAELVDAADSKSAIRKDVLVRVRPGAPIESITYECGGFFDRRVDSAG